MTSSVSLAATVDRTPYVWDVEIGHVRTTPLRNAFRYRSVLYSVDVDALPRYPWPVRSLARFRGADHLGGADPSLRAAVERFLAGHGLDLEGGRIRMVAAARSLGWLFNPLSVFWCHHADGRLLAVLAEVRNTYGQSFTYLLHPDERGRVRTDKRFYVSPFNPVDGEYRMSLPEPGERLELSVVLHRPEGRPFVATVRGRQRRRADAGAVLRATVRVPLATVRTSVQIRWQGVRLWARRLPVQPRPTTPPDDRIPQHHNGEDEIVRCPEHGSSAQDRAAAGALSADTPSIPAAQETSA